MSTTTMPTQDITWETRDSMIGKTIKVIYSGSYGITPGSVHKVTSVFNHPEGHYTTKVAGITVGVNGEQWVQEYEVIEDEPVVTGPPVVGQQVIGTDLPNEYAGKVATVTVVYGDGSWMGEVRSIQKPDDTVSLAGKEWEPLTDDKITADNIVGLRLKALDISGFQQFNGQEFVCTVYMTDNRSHPTGLLPKGRFADGRHELWVRRFEIAQPEHATVLKGHSVPDDEYEPSVGDYVRVTGELTDEGIVDGLDMHGTVQKVDNGVYVIDVSEEEVVSGPGYVFPADRPGDRAEDAPATVPADLHHDQIERLEKLVEDWKHDFTTLIESVNQEAIDRDWCDEYERVMGRIKSSLLVGEIPDRRPDRVQVTRRVQGTVYRDVQVWVDRGNERTTDTSEMYDGQHDDEDEPLGDDWASDILSSEYDNSGFDEIEVERR